MSKTVTIQATISVLTLALIGTACSAEGLEGSPEAPSVERDEESETTKETSAALSGTHCLNSAIDDHVSCTRMARSVCENTHSAVYCLQQPDRCEASYNDAVAACRPGGTPRLFRYFTKDGVHLETKVYDPTFGTVEGSVRIAKTTAAGANPLYRCRFKGPQLENSPPDFISLDPACEGQSAPISLEGYTFPNTRTGVKPLYRCRDQKVVGTFLFQDHFISLDSNCEGRIKESLLGYVL